MLALALWLNWPVVLCCPDVLPGTNKAPAVVLRLLESQAEFALNLLTFLCTRRRDEEQVAYPAVFATPVFVQQLHAHCWGGGKREHETDLGSLAQFELGFAVRQQTRTVRVYSLPIRHRPVIEDCVEMRTGDSRTVEILGRRLWLSPVFGRGIHEVSHHGLRRHVSRGAVCRSTQSITLRAKITWTKGTDGTART